MIEVLVWNPGVFKDVKVFQIKSQDDTLREKSPERQPSLDSLHWTMAWPDPHQTLIYSYSTPSSPSILLKVYFQWEGMVRICLVYANWNSAHRGPPFNFIMLMKVMLIMDDNGPYH